MSMTKKQSAFVAYIIEGESAANAYKKAFEPGTSNPDSLRSLASRERRRPEVADAIADGLRRLKNEAIEGALWNRRASIVARMNDLAAIEDENARRLDGLNMEIDGIRASVTLTDAEKMQLIGRAMQRPLVSRDIIAAKLAIYDTLDGMSETETDAAAKYANEFVRATTFDVDPTAYAANITRMSETETDRK